MAQINNSALVPALPNFLTWKAGNDLIPLSCSIHLYCVYHHLRSWSERSGLNLIDAINKLPKANQQRLLLAPELYYLLQSTPEPGMREFEQVKKYIQMEQYLCGQEKMHPGTQWTALGDCYFPGAMQEGEESVSSGEFSWHPELLFKARKLGHIVLDAFSPYAVNRYPAVMGEISQPTQKELAIATQRITDSLKFIRSTSSTAQLMIESSVQVLKIVQTPANTRTSSMSFRSTVGMVTLFNVHSEYWTVKEVVNAIIHESIHSMIYKLQLVSKLYTDEEAASRVTAQSPWSGRILFLHSYVHACFVWYGLWNFWNLIQQEDDESVQLKEKARKGFLSGSLLSSISSEAYESIHPETRRAIEEMYVKVTQN